MENNLWGDMFDASQNTEPVIKIIEEQALLLSQATNGKVKAIFEKIKYISKYEGLNTVLTSIAKATSVFKEEVDETKELTDANSFYNKGEYKFEIISGDYKYRIFTLRYSPVFPLKLNIERDILEDNVEFVDINTIDDAQRILSRIFKSGKVRFIIQEMMKK